MRACRNVDIVTPQEVASGEINRYFRCLFVSLNEKPQFNTIFRLVTQYTTGFGACE